MRANQLYYLAPLLVFLSLVILLWRGLSLHPNEVPSPLINHPMPVSVLPNLFNPNQPIQSQHFIGKITIVNVWATWCETCTEEHSLWMQLAPITNVTLVGFNYKDDAHAAKQWLHQNGNPYQWVMVDHDGKAALDWGVYGTPETFIIDKKGIIRYKHIGAINQTNWQQTLLPLILKLQSEHV